MISATGLGMKAEWGSLVESYFTNIFTTSYPSGFNCVLPTMTGEMNVGLFRPFTTEEVHKALHQMAPLAAPRLDGMSPIFLNICGIFLGVMLPRLS